MQDQTAVSPSLSLSLSLPPPPPCLSEFFISATNSEQISGVSPQGFSVVRASLTNIESSGVELPPALQLQYRIQLTLHILCEFSVCFFLLTHGFAFMIKLLKQQDNVDFRRVGRSLSIDNPQGGWILCIRPWFSFTSRNSLRDGGVLTCRVKNALADYDHYPWILWLHNCLARRTLGARTHGLAQSRFKQGRALFLIARCLSVIWQWGYPPSVLISAVSTTVKLWN